MAELLALSQLANERFGAYLRALDPAIPAHRVEFSRRITESWALIYYRRHLVRLSPYLFLLDAAELKHGSHWRELDATLRHEAAHAYAFHHHGHTGHSGAFHDAMTRLGLHANGTCDLGPENVAYRYVYGCPTCDSIWQRRAPLKGNYSCGQCAPGRFSPEHKLVLRQSVDLGAVLHARREAIVAAFMEGSVMREVVDSLVCGASSSSATLPRAAPASRSRTSRAAAAASTSLPAAWAARSSSATGSGPT